MVGGILFDMDGTLVESESIWGEEETRLAAQLGIAWAPETSEAWVGMPIDNTAQEFIARGADLPPEEIIHRLSTAVAQRVAANVPWLPGARDLLQEIAANEMPAAVVTNATRQNVQPILEGAPEAALRFAIAYEDVQHSKPHPEPYLRGAEKLGIDPACSIAFEDSISGATAARDAGLELWFVETQSAAPPWAVRAVRDLSEVTYEQVAARLERLAPQVS